MQTDNHEEIPDKAAAAIHEEQVHLQFTWTDLPEEELLKVRLCELGLEMKSSSFLERCISQFYTELTDKGFTHFKPPLYLGDEWFSPEGDVAISIPFYLAHPRLTTLERKFMLEAEGEGEQACMRLLRHEAGHCFDHAYKVSKRAAWRRLFGSPQETYDPENYLPRPYSRSFVHHLDNWYAQAHPDEDFAETFAIWLTPQSDWPKRYFHWKGALKKLQYVEALCQELKSEKPIGKVGRKPYNVSRLRRTLEMHYQGKRKTFADDFPDFFDNDLRAIFSGSAELPRRENGSEYFFSKHAPALVNVVCRATSSKKYVVSSFVKRLRTRAKEVDLRVGKDVAATQTEVAAYLAVMITHYLFTGNYNRRARWQKA